MDCCNVRFRRTHAYVEGQVAELFEDTDPKALLRRWRGAMGTLEYGSSLLTEIPIVDVDYPPFHGDHRTVTDWVDRGTFELNDCFVKAGKKGPYVGTGTDPGVLGTTHALVAARGNLEAQHNILLMALLWRIGHQGVPAGCQVNSFEWGRVVRQKLVDSCEVVPHYHHMVQFTLPGNVNCVDFRKDPLLWMALGVEQAFKGRVLLAHGNRIRG